MRLRSKLLFASNGKATLSPIYAALALLALASLLALAAAFWPEHESPVPALSRMEGTAPATSSSATASPYTPEEAPPTTVKVWM